MVKKNQQLESGQLAWFVLLSTAIRAITVVKICCDSLRRVPHILSTMTTRIVVENNTDQAKCSHIQFVKVIPLK